MAVLLFMIFLRLDVIYSKSFKQNGFSYITFCREKRRRKPRHEGKKTKRVFTVNCLREKRKRKTGKKKNEKRRRQMDTDRGRRTEDGVRIRCDGPHQPPASQASHTSENDDDVTLSCRQKQSI
jgi:hypothetical protein